MRDDDRPRQANLTRVVPVSIYLRDDADRLRTSPRSVVNRASLEPTASDVLDRLRTEGAQFAADLANAMQLLPYQLGEALGDLVARGLVSADGFGGLRRLAGLADSAKRKPTPRRGGFRPRRVETGVGRWSVVKESDPGEESRSRPDEVEAWAWQLLRRWGVVFRDLLDREQGAPRWYELVQFYRRAEARGEVRGGRFVSGVGGGQYALEHVVDVLRQLCEESADDDLVTLSAADPLNLSGILGDGERIPANGSNFLAVRNGVVVAAWQAGKLREFAPLDDSARNVLSKRFGRPTISPWERATRILDGDEDPGGMVLDETPPNADNVKQPVPSVSTGHRVS